jgi:hypothetical protein
MLVKQHLVELLNVLNDNADEHSSDISTESQIEKLEKTNATIKLILNSLF